MKEMTLEERKKTLLGIMDCIDAFCRENRLCYFLTYGTLLGAVRHKGFIPWDDDIDIAMPRKDYEKFSKLFNQVYSENFEFVDENNLKGYYLPFGKVIDKRTLLVEDVRGAIKLGVYVDVFPIDKMGNDLESAKQLNKVVKKRRGYLNYTLFKFGKKGNLYRTIIDNALISFFHLVPRKLLIKGVTQLAKRYDNIKSSKYMAIIVMMTYGEKEIMESKWFDDVVPVPFEGRQYNAPVGYHDVLTRFYNDYMQLPPVEKRVSHHSNIAWWRD